MAGLRSLRLVVTASVYFTAVSLGAGIFVVDPVRPLLFVPVCTGAVLLGHAVTTANLDELGYAIMGLWTGVLSLSVLGAVTDAFLSQRAVPPVVTLPAARVLGTVGLVAILVAAYVHRVRRDRPVEHQRSPGA
ncbi:hypothetical protein [Halobacterium jilantaiense]|uniref:hypothetical protein n=1 Tax=Halobacterium jilantaiense TaxID=355548 RepID=UPI000B7C91E6|nr:hypothetical protein [Halobacterium jilantaiense]